MGFIEFNRRTNFYNFFYNFIFGIAGMLPACQVASAAGYLRVGQIGALREVTPQRANKRYLELLNIAAKQSDARVDDALRCLLEQGEICEGKLSADAILALLNEEDNLLPATAVAVADVSLVCFDELLGGATELVQ